MKNKLWIDDIRPPPSKDWSWAKDSRSAIRWVLTHQKIDIISFDHDLGGDDTAMRVVNFLDAMAPYRYPKQYSVHSQNPVGRDNIKRAMDRIYERMKIGT